MKEVNKMMNKQNRYTQSKYLNQINQKNYSNSNFRKENRYIRKIKNEIRHGNIFNFRCKGVVLEIVEVEKDKYKAKIKVGEMIYEIPVNQNISLPNIVYEDSRCRCDLNPSLNINDVVELSVFKILKNNN